MKVGYARVSTGDQSLEPQLAALRRAGCRTIYHEHASGASTRRRELERAIAATIDGDELVVVKVDRLARSLFELLKILARLDERGARFRSLTEPIETKSAAGRLAIAMLGSFAEFERAMIRERTIEGLKAARARGARPGRKFLLAGAKGDAAMKLLETETIGRVALMLGVGKNTLKREIKRRRDRTDATGIAVGSFDERATHDSTSSRAGTKKRLPHQGAR